MDIRLLGLVEASHDGRDVPLGGPKPRALLAMLALQANALVSVDRLIDGLWGEHPPATAPKLVQVMVSQLRKQLAGSDAEILTRGRGYELRVDPDAVDALRFERLLRPGEHGSHGREALALWRGPPLDDLANEPFAAPEIRRLEDLWLRAREAAIDEELAEGRTTEALAEVDELIRGHPLREPLHGRRMLALYRSGRQADALEAFRDARRVLLDEIGLEPGPELRRLNDAILRQDPELDGPPARRPVTRRPRRRSRWLLAAAAAVAVVAVSALAMTLLRDPGGLDRIAEDSAGVIDPGDGRIVTSYPLGHAPGALAAGAGSVWSANGRDGTVSRVDRGQAVTIDVGGEPTALAFGDGSVWVADGEARRVDQINSSTNRVVGHLPAGNAPSGVAVTPGAVWVASEVDGQVRRLDLAHPGRHHLVDVPGGPAAITAGAGAVWVASESAGVVTKLDPRSGSPVKTIGVGNAPAALAVGFGSVWVANRDDGTVTRIDAGTNSVSAVSAVVPVRGTPVAVIAGLGAVWVADQGGAVIRIDPETDTVSRRTSVGSAPTALAIGGGSVWAATTASRASHRGGTLRYELAPEAGVFQCTCIDPAEYSDSIPVLSLAYDGLIAFRRVGGIGGSALVADLATSVPQPDDGGRTYTFQLRAGLRFSDGTAVRPTDFLASMERVVRLAGAWPYDEIAGIGACTPRRCDLSEGIETDDAARTITIRLRQPDAEFLYKLALSLAYVLPADTPVKLLRRTPAPGTGPYMITSSVPGREVRLQRNPGFHSWSSEARPDGFPDAITVGISLDEVGQIVAVQRGRSDAVVFAGAYSGLVHLAQARAIALADASRVHSALSPQLSYLFLNVHERPFDDLRVRRALNFAIDRRHMVALAGGHGLAAVSCQTIPPGLPGYAPTCPYTLDPAPGRGWSAPDLARARQLIAESGTRGERVTVRGPPRFAPVVRYAGAVLRRLGYHVKVRVMPIGPYYAYVNDSRHHAQVGFFNWIVDFPTSSEFFGPFSCARLIRGSTDNDNPSLFCDHAIDAGATAALAARGTDANGRWAALDRELLESAPLVPLFSRPELLLVSDRVGNAQVHQILGPLLDQFWVR